VLLLPLAQHSHVLPPRAAMASRSDLMAHMVVLMGVLEVPIGRHTAVQALCIAYETVGEARGRTGQHLLETMTHATDERPALVRMTQPASEGVEAKFVLTAAGVEYAGTMNPGACVALARRMCRHVWCACLLFRALNRDFALHVLCCTGASQRHCAALL
jgi:hypothetical protein